MISVHKVSKSFGPIKALQDISFEINNHEVVGFLGPNGAGKTTLMRLMTGIFPPSDGAITIDGEHLFHSTRVRKKIGYLAEHNPLYKELTVYEFLAYVSILKEIPRSLRKTRIAKVADQCGIGSVLKRLIGKLSKGYQQRTGLAQALVGDPEILILDEPTNGLDPAQIVEIRKLIKSLSAERTIILSTHILPEAEMTCGRMFILNEGKLVVSGKPGELAEKLGFKDGNNRLEDIFLKIVTKESELCPK